MRFRLEPMGLGTVLDTSLQVFKEHWIPIVALESFFFIPSAVGFLFSNLYPDSTDPEVLAGILWKVHLIVTMLVFPLAYGGVAKVVIDAYLGEEPNISVALRTAFSRYWSLLLTLGLEVVGVMVGYVFLVIPGVIFYLRCSFTVQVVVMEGLSGREAIRSSKALMEGLHLPVLLLRFLILFLSIESTSVGSFPFEYIGLNELGAIVGWGLSCLVGGFFSVVYVVLYFSQRCRLEGYDLQMAIRGVGENQLA